MLLTKMTKKIELMKFKILLYIFCHSANYFCENANFHKPDCTVISTSNVVQMHCKEKDFMRQSFVNDAKICRRITESSSSMGKYV